jgi:hypothetical protein
MIQIMIHHQIGSVPRAMILPIFKRMFIAAGRRGVRRKRRRTRMIHKSKRINHQMLLPNRSRGIGIIYQYNSLMKHFW